MNDEAEIGTPADENGADVEVPSADGSEDQKRPVLTVWTVATLGAALLGLVIAAAIVLVFAPDEQLAPIMSIVIAAVVTLGSAAFGITVAQEEGRKRGEAERGREGAEKEKDREENRRREAERQKKRAEDTVKDAKPLVEFFKKTKKAGESPAGSDGLELRLLARELAGGGAGQAGLGGAGDHEVLELEGEELAACERAAAAVEATLDEIE